MSFVVVNIANVVIDGAILGLSVARQCVQNGKSVVLIEKNSMLMNETASRNNEVIQAGIYCPKNSLKARFCIQGKNQLYRYLADFHIKYNKTRKIIFAGAKPEIEALDKRFDNGRNIGVSLHRMTTSLALADCIVQN